MLFTSHTESLMTLSSTYKTFLFDNDIQSVIPEIYLVIATLFLLVYGVFYSSSQTYPLLLITMSWLSLLVCVFTFLLVINNPISNAHIFYNTLVIDDFTTFLKGLLLVSTFCCILLSLDYLKQDSLNAFEFVLLLLFSTGSMLFLVSSADLISLYLALEFQSLCFYVLAAMKRNSAFSTEAGLKYFLLGAFSSGLLLFGCSLIYGFTGVTNFSDLARLFTEVSPLSFPACQLGMIFLLVGFFFKITAVPFHMWAPDVYEGTPTPITAFFVIIPKIAVFGVFLRVFLECFYDLLGPWQNIVLVSSLCSMLLGSVAALSQTRVKRLVAYSSIGHVGYLLAGFACGTIEGIQALFIYLFIYICMNINIFAFLLCGMRREHSQAVSRVKYITDLAFLAKTQPLVALTLTITLFSMAGIPPLAGFYSKAYLFFATLSSHLYVVTLVGVICSVVSCFYYIRLVKIMYFEAPKNWCSFSRIPIENAVILAITLFFLLFFMCYPTPLHLITHKIALTLCL